MVSACLRSANPTLVAVPAAASFRDHRAPELEDADDQLRRDTILVKYEWI